MYNRHTHGLSMRFVYPVMKLQRLAVISRSFHKGRSASYCRPSKAMNFYVDNGLLYETAGNLAACAGAASTVPQILMLIKSKDARSFSHTALGISLVSSTLWLIYGFGLELAPTIAASTIALLSDAYIVYCKMTFREDEK